MREIAQQRLKAAFTYVDGFFYWNRREGADKEAKRFNTAYAGNKVRATTDRYGYLTIQLDKSRMKMHRAVFAYHFGHYPETIDHINGNRADNRIENLRAATRSEQQWNKRDVIGCSKKGSRWRASIKANGVRMFLGSFGTQEEASKAYKAAKCLLHTISDSGRV